MDHSTPLDKSAILTATVVRYKFSGDQDACAKAVGIVMPNIKSMASSLARKAFGLAPVEDLIGAGVEECLRCINNYDTKQGPFLQYALRSIQGNMYHYLRDKTLDVKVSGRAKETMYAVNKYINAYRERTGTEPSIGTICKDLGYSYTRVEDALDITRFVTSSKQLEDYTHIAMANLDGTPEGEDPDVISPQDAKDIVRRIIELRKKGCGPEDFMALYGLDENTANDLVEAVDMYFSTDGNLPKFNSLVDWTSFSLSIEPSDDEDITI